MDKGKSTDKNFSQSMYHGKGAKDSTKSEKVKNVACHYCGMMGHLRAACRKRLRDEGKGGSKGKSGTNAVHDVSQPAAAGSSPAATVPKTSAQRIDLVAAIGFWS